MEHKGDLHPQIVLEDAQRQDPRLLLPAGKGQHRSRRGQQVSAGTLLAKTPREVSGTQDITGGLPRVTEIFEARKPKDPAVIAEIDGTVELLGEKRRGKRTIIVRSESGIEREHLVSHGKHLRVHAGDFVRAGEALVDGPLVPHDILRISGEEAVQQYLTREIQNVYRSQRVEINDKHIEIIVAQMLRKVRVETTGDTTLAARQRDGQVRVPRGQRGAGPLPEDHREGGQRLRGRRDRAQGHPRAGQRPDRGPRRQRRPSGAKPKAATASTQLLGITKAAVQSSSFISAASFQETTKVLTEAALAGKVDNLVGLKENVILGHLVPAGTGFRTYQDSEVRIRPQALEGLAVEKEDVLARHFPLLETAKEEGEGAAAGARRRPPPPPPPWRNSLAAAVTTTRKTSRPTTWSTSATAMTRKRRRRRSRPSGPCLRGPRTAVGTRTTTRGRRRAWLKFSELVRLLKKDGFRVLKEKGSVRYYGKPGWPRLVRIDYHGSREVPTGTCQSILRAAGLNKRVYAMIELPYSLVIEATEDPGYFGFYSAELEGFTGSGHSVEDCLYQAKWGMKEHVAHAERKGPCRSSGKPRPENHRAKHQGSGRLTPFGTP